MAKGSLGMALRYVHHLHSVGAVACLTDAQLLERFVARRDETAFEALVARHGSMVLAVCRGVLGDPNDAEDAFQATFLMLARKAGSVWVGSSLAGWLHTVSYRIACQASTSAIRRRRHEGRAAGCSTETVESPGDAPVEASESRRLLHDELDRLPDRLRIPVVLCYLEGRSYAEAASLLGTTEATVRGRLARARGRLHDRLVRRGLAMDGAPGILLISRAAPAPPPGMVSLTVRAASWVASGRATEAGVVATGFILMEEVLATMTLSKWKATTVGLAALVAGAWITTALAARVADGVPSVTSEGQPPARATSNRGEVADPGDARGPADRAGEDRTIARYGGLVLDPEGRPIEGAIVYLFCMTGTGADFKMHFEERARTDAAGRFRFEVDPSSLGTEPKSFPLSHAYLYATAEGHGPVTMGAGFPPDRAFTTVQQPLEGIEFRLARDDVPIVGRVVDLDGRGIEGATVTPHTFDHRQGPDGEPIALNARGETGGFRYRVNAVYILGLIPPSVTDAQGRFRLTGIGRERVARLAITKPGMVPQRIEVVTRKGRAPLTLIADPTDPSANPPGEPIARYDAAEFVHVVRPARGIGAARSGEAPGGVARFEHARTVYIATPTAGQEPPESLMLTEWLRKEIQRGTNLRVVNTPEEADLILQGTASPAARRDR